MFSVKMNALKEINQDYEKLTEDELGNLGIVLGAYRSFRGDRRKHIAYVGMPITSGKRLIDALSEEGCKTAEELITKIGKGDFFERIIKPNIEQGTRLADKLGQKRDMLFISPSVFEAKRWRWSQEAYMSLWYRVIGEMAGFHFVMDSWEYTIGGLREVFFSMLLQLKYIRSYNVGRAVEIFGLKDFNPVQGSRNPQEELESMWNIRVYNEDGVMLRHDECLRRAVQAIVDLKARGLYYQDHLNVAYRLMKIPLLVDEYFHPYNARTPLYYESRRNIRILNGETDPKY